MQANWEELPEHQRAPFSERKRDNLLRRAHFGKKKRVGTKRVTINQRPPEQLFGIYRKGPRRQPADDATQGAVRLRRRQASSAGPTPRPRTDQFHRVAPISRVHGIPGRCAIFVLRRKRPVLQSPDQPAAPRGQVVQDVIAGQSGRRHEPDAQVEAVIGALIGGRVRARAQSEGSTGGRGPGAEAARHTARERITKNGTRRVSGCNVLIIRVDLEGLLAKGALVEAAGVVFEADVVHEVAAGHLVGV